MKASKTSNLPANWMNFNWLHMKTKPFEASDTKQRRREELRRLKRELEVTRQERDILKRAMLLRSTTENERGYTERERSQRQDGVIA